MTQLHHYPLEPLLLRQLITELIEAHRKAHRERSSFIIPQHVFLVIHEQQQVYNGSYFTVIGTYARLETANSEVKKFFQREYGDYLLFGGVVKSRSLPDINGVSWWIDEEDGTLSLEALDMGDGDVFRVYARSEWVQG